jgi:hypothetical protein
MNKIAITTGAIVLIIVTVLSAIYLRHIGLSNSIKVGIVAGAILATPIYLVVDNLTDEYVGE